MKKCKICDKMLENSEYNKYINSDICRKCLTKEKQKQSNELINEISKDFVKKELRKEELRKEKRHKYNLKNKKRISKHRKKYYAEHKEDIIKKGKEYRKQNKDAIREQHRIYKKNKIHTDVYYKLKHNLRGRLHACMFGRSKSKSTLKLLGCSVKFLKQYLESKFQEGMTWENYGLMGWHIDHIIPCACFDLTKAEEQEKCFHYTNLQPLWAEDNLKKNKKYKYKFDF
jgi:hypothetical protein